MAYVLVYEQNFVAGNSLFSQTDVYHYTSHGTETAVGADSLYPDAYEAETVEVETGGGPGGENVLDWWNSPSGGGDDYGALGIWFRTPTVAGSPLTGVAEGAAEVAYKPNATSIAQLGTYPLLYLLKYNSPGLSISDSLFWLEMDGFSGRKLKLRFWDDYNGNNTVQTHTNAQPADTWWVYRVEWKQPTFTAAVANSDGYIRVYENGALIYEYADISGPKTNGEAEVSRGDVAGYFVGYYGLWGKATNIRIYAVAEPETEPIEPPPEVGTVPTRCDPPNPAIGPDPIGTLPPWVASCEPGGVVDSVADLSDGEYWG